MSSPISLTTSTKTEMKNIPLEALLDQLIHLRGGVNWDNTVTLSRMEVGLNSRRRSATRFSLDNIEAADKIEAELVNRGYIFTRSGSAIQGVMRHETDNYLVAWVVVELGAIVDHTVRMEVNGEPSEANSLIDWFKSTFNLEGSMISIAHRLDENGRVEYDRTFIPHGEAQLPRQSFYPWLGIPLEEYYKAFMESNENILVMFGEPGTAKSTFLRGLIASGNFDAMIAYNKSVVESPQLLRSFYRSPKARIMAYEDIDKHLGRREDDNTLMPALLNAADGVVRRKGRKLVFVTNLPSVGKIDPALLREGRCFDILKFDLLSPEEAVAVRVDMNLPDRDFSAKKGWTIAEILSEKSEAQQVINRFGKKVGFA